VFCWIRPKYHAQKKRDQGLVSPVALVIDVRIATALREQLSVDPVGIKCQANVIG